MALLQPSLLSPSQPATWRGRALLPGCVSGMISRRKGDGERERGDSLLLHEREGGGFGVFLFRGMMMTKKKRTTTLLAVLDGTTTRRSGAVVARLSLFMALLNGPGDENGHLLLEGGWLVGCVCLSFSPLPHTTFQATYYTKLPRAKG